MGTATGAQDVRIDDTRETEHEFGTVAPSGRARGPREP